MKNGGGFFLEEESGSQDRSQDSGTTKNVRSMKKREGGREEG